MGREEEVFLRHALQRAAGTSLSSVPGSARPWPFQLRL